MYLLARGGLGVCGPPRRAPCIYHTLPDMLATRAANTQRQETLHDLGISSKKRIFHFYRSCDINESCRWVLDRMPDCVSHLGGDMLERFKPETLAILRRLLATAESDLDHRLSLHAHSGGDGGLETTGSILTEVGHKFVEEAWSVIKDSDCLIGDMRCYKHGGQCSAWPSPAMRADRLMLAIGDNTCTPWSRMGSRRKWIHPATLCFMLWV